MPRKIAIAVSPIVLAMSDLKNSMINMGPFAVIMTLFATFSFCHKEASIFNRIKFISPSEEKNLTCT